MTLSELPDSAAIRTHHRLPGLAGEGTLELGHVHHQAGFVHRIHVEARRLRKRSQRPFVRLR